MLDAFVLDGEVESAKSMGTKKPIWVDVSGPQKPDLERLKQAFPLHQLTLEDVSKTGNRVKLEHFDEYAYIILYGIRQGKKEPETFQLNFILGKGFLITVHSEAIESFESLKKDRKKMKSMLSKGPDLLMHHLIDMEIDSYFPMLESIEDQIDSLEEEVYESTDHKPLGRLFRLKRQLLTIRRKAGPQKDVMMILSHNSSPFISERATAYYRDVYDHIIRINESIDDYREILSNTLEVHLSMVSNRMNEVMKALTVVATIMLPLTLVTSIYGMNLNIPESHFDFTYYIVLSVMFAIAVAMIV